jgi:hypothetical protein
MCTSSDDFIGAIERRKRQLDTAIDEAIDAYRLFRKKLDALPPDIAREAEKMLRNSGKIEGENTPNLQAANGAVVQDFAGKTAVECACTLITENHDQPMHFAVIARKSLARGYKGRTTSGTSEEIESRTAQSFWAAMSRSDKLQSIGKGLYQSRKGIPLRPLPRPGDGPINLVDEETTERKTDLGGKSIMEAAQAVLEELPAGRSMRYREILKEAQERGFASYRKGSSAATIMRSFYQTLANNARADDGIVERSGEGRFRLRVKAKADGG